MKLCFLELKSSIFFLAIVLSCFCPTDNEGAVKGDDEEIACVESLQRRCGLVVLLQVGNVMRDDEVLRAVHGFGGYEGSGEIKWIYKVGC